MVWRWGLVRVRGRSMLPTLRDGDLVLVDRGAQPRAGDIVVVRLPADRDGAARPLGIKRLLRLEADGTWWLDCDNPAEGVTSFDTGPVPPGSVRAVARRRLTSPLLRGITRDRGAARGHDAE